MRRLLNIKIEKINYNTNYTTSTKTNFPPQYYTTWRFAAPSQKPILQTLGADRRCSNRTTESTVTTYSSHISPPDIITLTIIPFGLSEFVYKHRLLFDFEKQFSDLVLNEFASPDSPEFCRAFHIRLQVRRKFCDRKCLHCLFLKESVRLHEFVNLLAQ